MKLVDNDEIIKSLENNLTPELSGIESEKILKFVIFKIDNKTYALPGEIVQEIVLDMPIYYLPFVPKYIRGLVNRHGNPYAVVDIKVLFEKEELDGNRFIIIRDLNEKICLIISEITKIVNIKESQVSRITSENEISDFFLDSIDLDDQEVPVLNIYQILKKISNDIS